MAAVIRSSRITSRRYVTHQNKEAIQDLRAKMLGTWGRRNVFARVSFWSNYFVKPSNSAGGGGASIQATTGPIWVSG